MKNMEKVLDSGSGSTWNRIRIHFFQMWIRGSGSTITERWIRGIFKKAVSTTAPLFAFHIERMAMTAPWQGMTNQSAAASAARRQQGDGRGLGKVT